MSTRRILILAGGASEEHEVSIISARSVLEALKDHPTLDASVLVVTREGRWLSSSESRRALADGAATRGGVPLLEGARALHSADVIFPLIHGTTGEDGKIQGLLELLKIPYIGSQVLASSLCMDKAMTKEVLKAGGIDQVASCTLTRTQFERHPGDACASVLKTLGLPIFVKPAGAGSSVGIGKVKTKETLEQAMRAAFEHDRRVLCEAGLDHPRELEVAVLGNDEPEASVVGEITFDAEFYDYETKYTAGRAELLLPAPLAVPIAEQLRELACRAFRLLDCAGFARIDFFMEKQTGRLYLNEVNTLPGFTPLSMYPKLWGQTGLAYAPLIERLVALAIARHGP